MVPPYLKSETDRETCAGIFTAQKMTAWFTASLQRPARPHVVKQWPNTWVAILLLGLRGARRERDASL